MHRALVFDKYSKEKQPNEKNTLYEIRFNIFRFQINEHISISIKRNGFSHFIGNLCVV